MKNTGCQGSICFSLQKDVTKMFFGTCPSRCNDGDGQSVGKAGKRFIGITGLDTVVIHAGEQYLARTTFLGFFCPRKQFLIRFHTTTVQVAQPSLLCLFGINCQYTNLRTEVLRNLVYQSGTANS